jgi:hypothetical protein
MAPNAVSVSSTTVLISPGAQTIVNVACSLGPQLTWDSHWRQIYNRVSAGIQAQANTLLTRGNVTAAEARALVESQRNEILRQMRNRISPFGRAYSEILKPSSKLPTLESLIEEKGSLEAVLRSVGKNNQVVNRLAIASRVAGPALIVIQITMTAVVILEAPKEQRGRVASREVGSAVGAASFGAGGAWAGCTTLAASTSWTLVAPIWGEVTTGGACIIGGIAGGLGLGFLGSKMGKTAGENIYDFVSVMTWTKN